MVSLPFFFIRKDSVEWKRIEPRVVKLRRGLYRSHVVYYYLAIVEVLIIYNLMNYSTGFKKIL